MDRTASKRELARQLGVTETAVRRAERAGRIKREAEGTWDLARVRAAWAGNTDPGQQRGEPSAGDGTRRAARRAVKPEAALGAVRNTLGEHGEPVSAGGMTFMQATRHAPLDRHGRGHVPDGVASNGLLRKRRGWRRSWPRSSRPMVVWWSLGLPRLVFSPEPAPIHRRMKAPEQFNRDTQPLVLDQARWSAHPLGTLWPETGVAS